LCSHHVGGQMCRITLKEVDLLDRAVSTLGYGAPGSAVEREHRLLQKALEKLKCHIKGGADCKKQTK